MLSLGTISHQIHQQSGYTVYCFGQCSLQYGRTVFIPESLKSGTLLAEFVQIRI